MSARTAAFFLVAVTTWIIPGCGGDEFQSCIGLPECESQGGTAGSNSETGGVTTELGGVSGSAGSIAQGGSSGSAGSGGVSSAGSAGSPGGAFGGDAGGGGTGGVEPAGGTAGVSCDGSCDGDTPVCDQASGTCVECTENGHCGGKRPICDPSEQRCVQCVGHADCPDADAASCVDSVCSACDSDKACAHIEGRSLCEAGVCVACTENDNSACDPYSCNVQTHECTVTPKGSVLDCRSCVTDSECGTFQDALMRCVPMHFGDHQLPGGFCLPTASSGCLKPYDSVIHTRSISDPKEDDFCSINQDTTTCQAIVDAGSYVRCDYDSDCGCPRNDWVCTSPGQGGICTAVSTPSPDKSCTVACSRDEECVGTLICRSGVCSTAQL